MPVALTGYALFLMAFMWLARFYFDNYLGYSLLFLSLAAFWPRDEGDVNDTDLTCGSD